jgi:hypothetical protein
MERRLKHKERAETGKKNANYANYSLFSLSSDLEKAQDFHFKKVFHDIRQQETLILLLCSRI